MPTRHLVAVFVALLAAAALAACGAGTAAREGEEPVRGHGAGEGSRVRADRHCTESLPSGERECLARGCEWSPPLVCRGVEAPPEIQEAERLAYERSTEPCVCVCAVDVERCAMVP